jgi:hypothetical protein
VSKRTTRALALAATLAVLLTSCEVEAAPLEVTGAAAAPTAQGQAHAGAASRGADKVLGTPAAAVRERVYGRLAEIHGEAYDGDEPGHDHSSHDHSKLGAPRKVALDYRIVLPDGTDRGVDGLSPADVEGRLGRKVELSGENRGGRFAVVPGGVALAAGAADDEVGPVGTMAATAPTGGTRRVAVMLVNFTDNTYQPWTLAEARRYVFTDANSVNAHITASSGGTVTLTGDAFGYYTITRSGPDDCRWTAWFTEVRAAAAAAGVDVGSYDNFIMAAPGTSTCGFAGVGYMPGTLSFLNGTLHIPRIATHELGHNLGFGHAGFLTCKDSAGARVALSNNCSRAEYGDPHSVMGHNYRLFHNWERARQGWQPQDQPVSASGRYTLAPVDGGSGTRILRLPRGNGDFMVLEFRQPNGTFNNYSLSDSAVTGVSVRLGRDFNAYSGTNLLDMSPENGTNDMSLKAGKSFTDPATNTTITVVSVSAAGAVVDITLSSDTKPPSAVSKLVGYPTDVDVMLNWVAATDDVGVSHYRAFQNNVLMGTTTNRFHAFVGLTPSTTYTFGIEAVDLAGNIGPRSSVTVKTTTTTSTTTTTTTSTTTTSTTTTTPTTTTTVVADTTPPSTPTGFTASVRSKKVNLSWNAASDNVGVVSYTVSRPGWSRTVTGLTASNQPPRGTYTYTVVARDAAGNASAPASVTVTM